MARAGQRASVPVLALSIALAACGGTAAPSSPTPPAARQMSSTARAYLTALLDVMEANALERKTIDWPAFRRTVVGVDSAEQTIADLYPKIRAALSLLNDHHSFYVGPDGTVLRSPSPPGGCVDPAPPAVSVPDDIGYVRVGGFGGVGPEETEFAQGIQNAIRAGDRAGLAGWIVDVRNNGGGNMWPMVAGVGPILGVGTAGGFVDPDGHATWWGYRGDASVYEGSALVVVPRPYSLLRGNPAVAVLTNCWVASSGEAVVIGFRARPNTRSFGTATYGLSTSNDEFPLTGGGTLYLTTATMADRTEQVYGRAVAPDEVIADPGETVRRAIEWLRAAMR